MAQQVEAGKAKAAGIVGIMATVLGFGIFICGCIWASYGASDATGLWSGILQLIAGVLGIVTWAKKNKCAMIAMLVFYILDIILMAVQCVLALIVWLVWQLVVGWVEKDCNTTNGKCVCGNGRELPLGVDDCDWVYTIDAVFLAITILAALAAIISFVGSIIGCMGVCCGQSTTHNTTVIVQQQPGQQQQVVMAPINP